MVNPPGDGIALGAPLIPVRACGCPTRVPALQDLPHALHVRERPPLSGRGAGGRLRRPPVPTLPTHLRWPHCRSRGTSSARGASGPLYSECLRHLKRTRNDARRYLVAGEDVRLPGGGLPERPFMAGKTCC
jgi:hypothetical protein